MAGAQYKRYGCTRMSLCIMVNMANEYLKSRQYPKALQVGYWNQYAITKFLSSCSPTYLERCDAKLYRTFSSPFFWATSTQLTA